MASSRPIVCTLRGAELRDRGKAWRKLWASGMVRRERAPHGIRLEAEPGAVDALHQLIELEQDCCAWIDFAVDGRGATLTADGFGEAVLATMFRPS